MNKRTMLVGLLVAIMSVSAFGAGFMGPPTAELQKGQWSIGYNYMYSDMDLDDATMTWRIFADDEVVEAIEEGVEYLFGIDEDDVDDLLDELDVDDIRDLRVKFKSEIKDVKVQRHYATLGYGIMDQWEVYVQLGIADVKASQQYGMDLYNYSQSFNFDNDFAFGWGTKYTFYEQETIRWGASLQMNWLDTSWEESETWDWGDEAITWKSSCDIETYDMLIAVGPTADMGGWKLYGGPFYYYLSGDLDHTETIQATVDGDVYTAGITGSGELEADSNFGGFVGAQIPLSENTDLTTELSFTGDGWALGAGIAWKF